MFLTKLVFTDVHSLNLTRRALKSYTKRRLRSFPRLTALDFFATTTTTRVTGLRRGVIRRYSTTDHPPNDTVLPLSGRSRAHLQRKLRALDDHRLAGLDHAGSTGRFRAATGTGTSRARCGLRAVMMASTVVVADDTDLRWGLLVVRLMMMRVM